MIATFSNKIFIVFFLTTLLTLLLVYLALKNSNYSKKQSSLIIIGLLGWLVLQGVLTLTNVYNTNINSMPPKIFIFGIFPTVAIIILLFVTNKGRNFIDGLSLKSLTLISCVRLPVELVLYWLFIEKTIPKTMTFEGTNFDIIAGISAPIVAFFCFKKDKITKNVILTWNFICLALVINVVIIGILSSPTPFQQMAFEQPNIAIINFPISWLPTFIVPIVMLSHLISIRKIILNK